MKSLYSESVLMAMTHSPETGAESRLGKIGADFWTVCHRHKCFVVNLKIRTEAQILYVL